MKQYDSYKDSGIEWIGKIPSHWDCVRLKFYCAPLKSGGTPKSDDQRFYSSEGTPWVAISDMSSTTFIYDTEKHLTKEGIEDKRLVIYPVGTLLYSIYATLGKVSELKVPACINQAILAISPKSEYNRVYFRYCLQTQEQFVFSLSNGNTQNNLNADKVANFNLVLPPLSEQQNIATYLEEKCGEIDKAIATQEKRVELLKELRQNIITQAVTRGIHPDAPLKDSGVEWIGEVPEHWEVMKTSLIYSNIGSGTTPSTSNTAYYTEGEDGFFWLQTGDLNDGEINNTSKKITEIAIKECNLKFYPVNSVVIAMYGATIGKVGLLKIKTATNQACCVLPHSNKMIPNFSFYLYLSAKTPMLLEAMGGGQPNISQDIIKKLRIPVPPLSEQQEIVSYIESQTARLDKSIEKAEHQIELLQELKQSVITEVVTGKRKVC